jgi:cytochrome P450
MARIRQIIDATSMTDKKSIRPEIRKLGDPAGKSPEEKFQNETLRPILKLQHDLIILFFKNHLARRKVDIATLSPAEKSELLTNLFGNDNRFKTELRGLIIGHFTPEEYSGYQNMAPEMNRRILAMAKQRLLSAIL